jgi:glycosyltransferase involved in cell wall biosynthesis
MNILLSIHHELDINSGAPGVTLKVARAMRARGHTVAVVSFDDLHGIGMGNLRKLLFPWWVFQHVLRHPEYEVLDLSSGDGWVVNMVRRLFNWRPHLLSATRSHGLEHAAHDLYRASCRQGLEKMSWKYPFYHGSWRLLECRLSLTLADVVLVLNEHERHYLMSHFGMRAEAVTKVENGIDEHFTVRAQRAANEAPQPGVEPRNVAFLGSFLYHKGTTFLAPAMTHILEKYPNTRFGLFGTGIAAEQVLSVFPAALHDRITVAERYDNGTLPQVLADYQILAFPSVSEGFGLVALEAMACGLVPVSSSVPGPLEFIHHERNGLVVPTCDAIALEAAIGRLLDDATLWARLKQAALLTATNFAWGKLAQRLEQIYVQRLNGVPDGRSVGD